MAARLLAVLILCIAARAPAQELESASPRRFLQLPDVTLSAEDPLFLEPPPDADLREEAAGQPDLDKLALSPVETPFPAPAPPDPLFGLSWTGQREPAELEGTVPVDPLRPWSPRRTSGPKRPPKAWEYGFEFRHVFAQSTLAGLRFEGDWRSWTLSGEGECSITDECPSYAEVQLQADRSAEPRGGDFYAGAAAVFSSEALLAGGLEAGAGLELEGQGYRLASFTKARIEGWQTAAVDAGWIWQAVEALSTGPGLGMYGAAAASICSAPILSGVALDGLARYGFSWRAVRFPLQLRAGAALLYYGGVADVVPEFGLELQPAPALRLQTGLGPFFEEPLRLQVRALYDPFDQSGLRNQAGVAARGIVLLDWPRIGGARIMVLACDGFQYRLREGVLRWERARELQLDAASSWTLLPGSERRAGMGFQLGASAVLPLPVPERALDHLLRRSLDGGFDFSLPNPPLDLAIQAHWGDFPLQNEQALLTGSRSPFSGWMASLRVRGGRGGALAWYGGVEVRQPGLLKGVFGWSTQARVAR